MGRADTAAGFADTRLALLTFPKLLIARANRSESSLVPEVHA